MLTALFQEAKTIPDDLPADPPTRGSFKEAIIRFAEEGLDVESRKEDLLRGIPSLQDDRMHFRLDDLVGWMRSRSYPFARGEIMRMLHEQGARQCQISIQHRPLRAWAIPMPRSSA